MKILDDPTIISAIDTSKMLEITENWPNLLEEGYKLGKNVSLPNPDDIQTIIFVGMGGSAIGGNFISDIFNPTSDKSFIVLRSYDLPTSVNPDNTLIIALSYSGNTEETLSAAYQALKRNVPTVFITSNGEMIRQAKRLNVPYLMIKPGLQPRAAFPLLFGSLLGVLQANHLLHENEKEFDLDWEETLITLRTTAQLNSSTVQTEQNESKLIASEIYDGLPIIFTAYESLGIRWRSQFNENAKILAQEMIFPEMCHNHIEAFEQLPQINVKGLVLQTGTERSILKQRLRITTEIIEQNCQLHFRTIHGKGSSNLAKFLSLAVIGDFTSIYLSILRKIDPTPVKLISLLKKRLEDETTFKKGLLYKYEQFRPFRNSDEFRI